MSEGAVGFSTGLIYMPGEFSTDDELSELAKEIKPWQGFYVTHIRNESEGVFEALDGALGIGRKAGVPVHISHLKLGGQAVWGRAGELLDQIDQANRQGIETSFDVYPYTAGMTGLAACMPPWAFEGGVEKLLVRIQDPATRRRIVASIQEGIPGWQNMAKAAGSWENIVVSTLISEENKWMEGKSIKELADQLGKDPYSTIFDLLLLEKGRIQIVTHMMDEADLQEIIRHPLVMIGSDGMSVSTEGLMSFGRPHPRAFGTRARVLERYVRTKILSIEKLQKNVRYAGGPARPKTARPDPVRLLCGCGGVQSGHGSGESDFCRAQTIFRGVRRSHCERKDCPERWQPPGSLQWQDSKPVKLCSRQSRKS